MIATTLITISMIALIIGAYIILGQGKELKFKDTEIALLKGQISNLNVDVENANHTIETLEKDLKTSHQINKNVEPIFDWLEITGALQ